MGNSCVSRSETGPSSISSTISEFCVRHQIGRTTYFKLRKDGLGPGELRFGRLVRITAAAEREWLERMQLKHPLV